MLTRFCGVTVIGTAESLVTVLDLLRLRMYASRRKVFTAVSSSVVDPGSGSHVDCGSAKPRL